MEYSFLNAQQGGIQNSRRSSRLIRHACRLLEKWMSIFFLYRSRKHWKCKYFIIRRLYKDNFAIIFKLLRVLKVWPRDFLDLLEIR